jgi:glycosyltransferase involved in cell wall biosynthesis
MVNFSIVLIMRNEAKVLPKLGASVREFLARGGKVIAVDTGSKDDSVEVAKKLGFEVHEVGEKYKLKIDESLAEEINKKFIVDGEEPVVKTGDTFFDFSSARASTNNRNVGIAAHHHLF